MNYKDVKAIYLFKDILEISALRVC